MWPLVQPSHSLGSWVGYGNLGRKRFSLTLWKVSSHRFLAPRVAVETSDAVMTCDPRHVPHGFLSGSR